MSWLFNLEVGWRYQWLFTFQCDKDMTIYFSSTSSCWWVFWTRQFEGHENIQSDWWWFKVKWARSFKFTSWGKGKVLGMRWDHQEDLLEH